MCSDCMCCKVNKLRSASKKEGLTQSSAPQLRLGRYSNRMKSPVVSYADVSHVETHRSALENVMEL